MIAVAAIGFALGVDSFQVSLGLGLLKLSLRRRAAIALAFGVCDGLMSILGLALGESLAVAVPEWMQYAGPALIGLYGLYTIGLARCGAQATSDESLRWAIVGLPICLSIDNLVAGVGLGMLTFPFLPSAIVVGSISAALAGAGLAAGRSIGQRLPFRAEWASGLVLTVVAAVRVAEWF